MARTPTTATKGPAIRARSPIVQPGAQPARPALMQAAANAVITDEAKREAIDTQIAVFAKANEAKNKGTREEKAAKTAVEAIMEEFHVTEHRCMVTFDNGSVLPYIAKIEEGSYKPIDLRVLADACDVKLSGKPEAIQMFLGMLSTTQKAVKDTLGENMLFKATMPEEATPAALSIGKEKG